MSTSKIKAAAISVSIPAATNYNNVIDELGIVNAQIAELTTRAEVIKKQLVARGKGAYEGDLFRATVSEYDQKTLNQTAVRAKLSRQFIRANTKTKTVMAVRVTSRNSRGIPG